MIELPVIGSDIPYAVAPGKIIALGLNYRDHVAESSGVLARETPVLPTEPIIFAKTPNVLIGPGEDIVVPATFLRASGIDDPRTDYEAELAVIIGTRCRNVSPEDARRHVFGYTCFNDVSQRNIQNSDRSGWFRGKSFDTFGPIGPVVVPDRLVPDPMDLDIECRLNGCRVQKSNTRSMIFDIWAQIAYISAHMTLEPGDIIVTGTPGGVGRIRGGDVVEVEIAGIGTLRNPVREV